MIFRQSEFPLSRFGYCDFVCDEVFLSHLSYKDCYRQHLPSLSFGNELHDWLLRNVIWRLERKYGGILFETIPVKSKDGDAYCAVRVVRNKRDDDRVFANMVHRAIIGDIEQSFPTMFSIYYRLLENETLFQEGKFCMLVFNGLITNALLLNKDFFLSFFF